jgi:hypothetical protein
MGKRNVKREGLSIKPTLALARGTKTWLFMADGTTCASRFCRSGTGAVHRALFQAIVDLVVAVGKA